MTYLYIIYNLVIFRKKQRRTGVYPPGFINNAFLDGYKVNQLFYEFSLKIKLKIELIKKCYQSNCTVIYS